MRICFDIDGVLCTQVTQNYEDAQPNREMIGLLNRLFEDGNHIVLYTSRFMGRAKGDRDTAERIGRTFTEQQLADWEVRYHELWMGKPRYDFVIDDRSVFFNADIARIEQFLKERSADCKH